MRQEWRLEATIENQVNDTFLSTWKSFRKPSPGKREEKSEIGDMTDSKGVCACVCVTFTRCYPEHTMTVTQSHKKKKKAAFCHLPLSEPPGAMCHTDYNSLLFSLSGLSVDRYSKAFSKSVSFEIAMYSQEKVHQVMK